MMTGLSFEPDSSIRVHERGVIAQLCSLFRSHEQGLPEWFKNASAAYARENALTEHRVLTLLVGLSTNQRYVALLDHGGMTVADLEEKFANWGDPEAHRTEVDTDEVLEGGHGNGGKCYMTQMFGHSYILTAKTGRGSKYGFIGDDPRPGYFPNKREGRGFPISRAVDELKRGLADLGVDFAKLPEEVRILAAQRSGFTLVVGFDPKQLDGKDVTKKLVESVVLHPQMLLTTEKNRIYVVVDGKTVKEHCPVQLPEIEPHEWAPEPKVIDIPEQLEDPETDQMVSMTGVGARQGRLTLKTSKTSMRWNLKGRHHIRHMAHGRPVAFLRMENISRSHWVDRMYGECQLDALTDYETPDRSALAIAPLTRALEAWVKDQVFSYEAEFKQRDKLSASQEERNKLQVLNDLLNRWKNKFLDETFFKGGSEGEGEGSGKNRPSRPLPQVKAASVKVASRFSKAGVGVWLRLSVAFRDAAGNRVASPPFLWWSDDWAVATVDDNKIVTHAPGDVVIWLETEDKALRSEQIRITVIDTVSSRVEPSDAEVKAGEARQLTAIVTDRFGLEHEDVFMTWVQDDSSIVRLGSNGLLVGQKQGSTAVYAIDEQCADSTVPTRITVKPADALPGDDGGRAYPRILLSEVDEDPLHPDGDTVHLSPEDGPVHQPTPQHVEKNIWWINLNCPLAKMYFEDYGPESTEWRSYHLERFIEALVKIRLAYDFQNNEEELTFDSVERRWREIAAEVQRRALIELRPMLEGREVKVG